MSPDLADLGRDGVRRERPLHARMAFTRRILRRTHSSVFLMPHSPPVLPAPPPFFLTPRWPL